jgi:hypothetical protein
LSRIEGYIVAFATLLLSVYWKEIIGVLRRGWTHGRLNLLKTNLGEVEAMHSSMRYLLVIVGVRVLRALFLIGLLILGAVVYISKTSQGGSGTLLVPAVFGILIGGIFEGISRLHRVVNYEAYASRTQIKIDKITERLQKNAPKPTN